MLVITPPVILINVISPLAVSLWLFKSTVPFSILEFVTWDVILLFIVNVPLVNVELLILLIDDTVLAFNDLPLKLTFAILFNTTLFNNESKSFLIVTFPLVIVELSILLTVELIPVPVVVVNELLFKSTFAILFTETFPFVIVELLILLTVELVPISVVNELLFKLTFAILFNVTSANDEVKLLLTKTSPFVIVELLILLTDEPLFAVNE